MIYIHKYSIYLRQSLLFLFTSDQMYPQGRYPNQQYQQYAPNHQFQPPNNQQMANPQRGSLSTNYTYNQYNASLIQPPALNQEQALDTNSQMFQQRGPMTMSNNEQSEFAYHMQEQEDHQAQIASMFWEQRCMTLLERFQWFFERFQILRNDHLVLSEEMQRMDSQDQWHTFQQHHEQFHEKIEQMQQELSAVVSQNEQLLNQRPAQDNQNVWEQRYQQLLGNFKSLQEQTAHKQAQGMRGGVPPQQYQQLEQHCAELQYQYQQVFNELKMHRQGGYPAQIQNQLNAYMQEIQAYKQKLNSLHGENVELQKMLQEFQGENNQLKQERYKLSVDKSKFEDLIRQVQQKEYQIHSLQEQFKNKSVSKSNVHEYLQQIQNQKNQIQNLKNQINEKDKQVHNINAKLQQIQSESRLKMRDQLQKDRKVQQTKVQSLQQEIQQLRQQLHKTGELTLKIQNLQRKLSYSNQQVTNLNENLKKKNQQLIELRSLTYQVEKFKQAQTQLLRSVQEKDRLADNLRRKSQQIEKLHQQIQKLSNLLNQTNSKKQQFSTRNLRTEIQDLTDNLRRYQGQINKLKSIINIKEEYNEKLQQQNKQTRERLILIEQILQNERSSWKEKEIKFSTKGNDYNERIRALDYQFNLQLKDTLEREIGTLRKQNLEKQQIIRSLQQKELINISKLSILQKQQNSHNKDLSLQKQKEKQLQKSLQAQLKKYRQLQSVVKQKQQHLSLYSQKINELIKRQSLLNMQINQHQTLIKAKNKTIKQLQDQILISVARSRQTDKLMTENTHLKLNMEALERQKAKEQSPLVKSKSLSIINSRKNLEPHESIIAQLHKENEALREQVAKVINKYAQKTIYGVKQSKPPSLDLNKRLIQFNEKLQVTIGSQPNQFLSRTQSQKTFANWQRQRNQIVDYYQNQLKALKQQLQTKKMSNSQASNEGFSNHRKSYFGQLQSERLKEQITFLKKKCQQEQDRIKHLITINQDLRGKIDSMLKIKQNSSTLDYYKDQLQRTQAQRELLKQRLRKLIEDNKEYKLELTTKNTKVAQEYEFKVLQLQILIQQQQRKITLLQGQKSAAQNSKASLQHDLNIQGLSKNLYKNENYAQAVASMKSSQQKKQSIQQQFGSVIGNLSGYENYENHSSYGASSGLRQGNRYKR